MAGDTTGVMMRGLNRRWAGFTTRALQKAGLNLGVIANPSLELANRKRYRRTCLEELDAYYENRQYAHLPNWEEAAMMDADNYIPVRARQPRIKYAFGKFLCQRVASKIVGMDTFPMFVVEDDPDTQMFLRLVAKLAKLQAELIEPIRRALAAGSSLVRYYFVEGTIKVEHYCSKYCYPVFNASGELHSVRIQYVYEDPDDLDEKGKPREKWYRLDLGEMADVLFDNPEFNPNVDPVFTPVNTAEHGLGFVQAVWIRTSKNKHHPDGYSLLEDIKDFIDEICYSLSQSSVAVGYNQDPQLTIKGMDADGIEALIRSSAKAWNLGRADADAQFLESTLNGVEKAIELREKMKMGLQDVARVVMHDPEKLTASAQSAKAMEVMHGPLLELINELRPMFEEAISSLLLKIALTMLLLKQGGAEVGITMPNGWRPKSLNLSLLWPPIFPMTMEDLAKKAGVANTLTAASIFSRETMTRWLAKDFGVEDIEDELAKIAKQPVLNPFGTF